MTILSKNLFVFCVGFVIGVILAVIFFESNTKQDFLLKNDVKISRLPDLSVYNLWFDKFGLTRKQRHFDLEEDKKNVFKTEANFLYEQIPIICVIFVKTDHNAYTISNTWGKRCNYIDYFGESTNKYLSVIKFKSIFSWRYLCLTIRLISKYYGSTIKWVFFSPDDIFMIPENLRFVLASKNYTKPYYIGHKALFWNQVYNDKRAGYVLSRGAIELLIKKFNSSKSCSVGGRGINQEDFYLGQYLSELGVVASDALDENGLQRFHFFTPAQLTSPGSMHVIEKYSPRSITPVLQGARCCSNTSISFRGSDEDLVYLYSYLQYQVNLFSQGSVMNKLSNKYVYSDEVWQHYVKNIMGIQDPNLVSKDDYYKLWSVKVDAPEKFNQKLKEIILSSHHNNFN